MDVKYLEKLIKMFENIMEQKEYQEDKKMIQQTYLKISNLSMLKEQLTVADLDVVNDNIQYLDMKYDNLYDLVNLYDPIRISYKKLLQKKHVDELRKENRTKKEGK